MKLSFKRHRQFHLRVDEWKGYMWKSRLGIVKFSRWNFNVFYIKFSVLHVVHTGSGAHPASYPMGNGGAFLGGKAAGA
jgi:hypothetical protein